MDESSKLFSMKVASENGGVSSTDCVKHILLIFAGRRPRPGMIRTLCKVASTQGSRFTVVRAWTMFSCLALLMGGSTANEELDWIREIVEDLGVNCELVIWRDKTYPQAIIHAAKAMTPDFVCVVPAAIGNGDQMRSAIGVVGRTINGMLVIDQPLA